jgi:hypothetical protein
MPLPYTDGYTVSSGEGETGRQWVPTLLIVAAVIAFFAFVVGR